jgi:hypothetical protein
MKKLMQMCVFTLVAASKIFAATNRSEKKFTLPWRHTGDNGSLLVFPLCLSFQGNDQRRTMQGASHLPSR